MSDPADHPLQGGEPHLRDGDEDAHQFAASILAGLAGMPPKSEQPAQSRNIGPGDDDYGRTPKSWNVGAPLIDQYKAGPCPTCGEFAIGAERRPDGLVHCRSRHTWPRKYVGCDMAKPGSDTTVATFTFGYVVTLRKIEGGMADLQVRDDAGEVRMSARLAEFPSQEEIAALVKGIKTAATGGINNIDFRIRNPMAADIVDRFFKRS